MCVSLSRRKLSPVDNLESSTSLKTALVQTTQFNCDLSDAVYAGNYTMCIYLLKMRELYRWKKGYALDKELSMSNVASWIQQAESRWDEIEEKDYQLLRIGDEQFELFDDVKVNQRLETTKLVYSGGYGVRGKPIFFLADRLSVRKFRGLTAYIAGNEHARELAAPPAMLRGKTIYVRSECLRRMLWEMVDEWSWKRRPGAMSRVVNYYNFDADKNAALNNLASDQLEQLLLHECGEYQAGEILGDDWNNALLKVIDKPLEIISRAVRDCFADSLQVIPDLIERARPELLHFYIASLSPLRKSLMPGILAAYESWLENGSLHDIVSVNENYATHWMHACRYFTDVINNDEDNMQEKLSTIDAFAC
jgi:hypothetical protein